MLNIYVLTGSHLQLCCECSLCDMGSEYQLGGEGTTPGDMVIVMITGLVTEQVEELDAS